MDLGVLQFATLDERQDCEESLLRFLELAWKYIDPSPFVTGWHLEAIAEHLQAVTDGHIRRLIINVPPRTSKSSLVSVAWPAWIWCQSKKGPLAGPHVQFLSASYAHTLSLRDSVKMRRLIQSPWYQKHWGKRFSLTGDVNTKGRFECSKGGYRLASSVDGTLTGEGGDIILLDDPNNATEVESEVVRESTNLWLDEVVPTRLNDPKTGAIVIVQQRLHQDDVTGHTMAKDHEGYVWLMLPMRHELDRHCITYVQGEKFWEDPRTEDNELLCPERFSTTEVERLERTLGPTAFAGQMQQRPQPRGGGIIQEDWWQPWIQPHYPAFEFTLAALDTAYTEKSENDPSALSIWGLFRDKNNNPRIMLIYSWQARLAFPDLCQRVTETCTKDQRICKYAKPNQRFKIDRLLIENKAAGISVAQELHRTISFNSQFGVELFDPKKYGDKVARCYAVQHLFSEELIYVPWPTRPDGTESPQAYAWAQEMIEQFSVFPKGTHDDLVDSGTMALRYLREAGMLLRQEEHSMDVASELAYTPRVGALYPC